VLVTPPLAPEHISRCETFFSHTLPRCLLPATYTHLEELALSFSDPVCVFYLSYNFSDLFFPAFRALHLQHVQFSSAHDAEHLVTRHADTLLELHLAHCKIAVALNGSENPQAAVAAAKRMGINGGGCSDGSSSELLPLPLPDNNIFDGWPVDPRPWSDIYGVYE
jgi:hypothetical protein